MSVDFNKRALFTPRIRLSNSVYNFEGAGFPASGTAGVGAGFAGKGSQYYDRTRGTRWVNTGSTASPYWQPTSFDQGGMWGVFDDFRYAQGAALSDTGTSNLRASGLRVGGQGIDETDAGALENALAEGGVTLRMTTTDEVAHTIFLGTKVVSSSGPYQPDQHGMGIVEAYLTHVSAITTRGMGIGFVGLLADALDPPITCATTVATLVQDDMTLLHFNTGYTAGDHYKIASNKSDAAATATATDTGIVVAAAATYSLLRVEVEPNPSDATKVIMRAFVNKALVGTVTDALDEDEEANPVLYIESTSTAVKSMDVGRFAFVTGRPTAAA